MLIRAATGPDFGVLAEVEEDADRRFDAVFGPGRLGAATAGDARRAAAGFVLVAVDSDGAVEGFVHVLDAEPRPHLEQLSVRVSAGGRGIGRALVESAKRRSAERGATAMTLRTFADVPWNAPFHRRRGFVTSEPDTAFRRELVEAERRLGLLDLGRRVQMTAVLEPARSQPGGKGV